jgi:Ca2+-binding RTX toxin-like protein
MKYGPILAASALVITFGPASTATTSVAGIGFFCDSKPTTMVVDEGTADAQGTDGDDVVMLLGGDHDFEGLGGDDTICAEQVGHEGSRIHAGAGNDWVDGGWGFEEHPVEVYGGKGSDTLTAIRGTIKAGPGDDRVVSSVAKHLESTDVDLGSGDDTVVLQSALSVSIDAGTGADTLRRANPPDGLESDRLEDVNFAGGPGDDTVSFASYDFNRRNWLWLNTTTHQAEAFGTISFDSVLNHRGSPNPDHLVGSSDRRDRFWGLGGDDVLTGQGGDDLLLGGADEDTTVGGTGRDTCRAESRIGCELS